MVISVFGRFAPYVGVAAVMLAGCGVSQPLVGAPDAVPQVSALAARANSKNYKVLYSFGAFPDGNYPHSDLIGVGGTFYGTTFAGGENYCGSSRCGTVFSITTSGAEKVLHSFGNGTDGFFPFAGLTCVDGTLYGTTGNGGSNNAGTGGRSSASPPAARKTCSTALPGEPMAIFSGQA